MKSIKEKLRDMEDRFRCSKCLTGVPEGRKRNAIFERFENFLELKKDMNSETE